MILSAMYASKSKNMYQNKYNDVLSHLRQEMALTREVNQYEYTC